MATCPPLPRMPALNRHHFIARGIERRRIFGHQYSGHSVLTAKRKNDRQDTDKVPGMFGENFVKSHLHKSA